MSKLDTTILEKLPANIGAVLSAFVNTAKNTLGSDLVSIVLYGSGAEGKLSVRCEPFAGLVFLRPSKDRVASGKLSCRGGGHQVAGHVLTTKRNCRRGKLFCSEVFRYSAKAHSNLRQRSFLRDQNKPGGRDFPVTPDTVELNPSPQRSLRWA
jgi:hypothetical protein